jgi:hypothetical protein
MSHYVSKIKEKMLEFTQLFCLETSKFQRFVIIYKYVYFLNSDPVAKGVMQKIFEDTAKVIGEDRDRAMDEDKFVNIKGKALFSREFWIYYTNLEVIHGKMKNIRKCCITDNKEFDNLYKLFSKPYSKQMLELSFKVVNSEVFDRLDKECFLNDNDEDNKTSFDDKKGVLYVRGVSVEINKQNKITNAHKILRHIFITNRDNIEDDFFYAEIAEDEFHELDYKNRKNNWRKYLRACEDVNNKVKEQNKEVKHFLKFSSGIKGKVKVNKKYF